MKEAFAVWLTGLPASGKSTIARELTAALVKTGVTPETLESDVLRRVLTPDATYSPSERDLFYRALALYGSRLVAHGVSVIFDATANRRHYRDFARELISRFLEVAIVTGLLAHVRVERSASEDLCEECKLTAKEEAPQPNVISQIAGE